MKIAAILPRTEYFSSSHGGALATWFHEVYKRLYLDVRVVSIPTPNCYSVPSVLFCKSDEYLEKCYSLIQTRSLRGYLNPVKNWLRNSYNRKSARLCFSFYPDIIHIQNDYGAVLPIKKLNPYASLILHMQNDHLVDAFDLEQAEKACHAADKLVFCSEYLRRNVLNTFPSVSMEKTCLIFNGAGNSFIHSPIRKFQADPCLLFVGRIVPEKGLHILLEALDDVFVRYPKATLRIVGGINFGSKEENDYIKSLQQKASIWGNRIIFVGPVSHDKIALEFSKADIFICSSIWNEPLGMVNAEAMASGLPIVAFAKGGIPEIVEDAGILVQDASPTCLAEAINTVLDDFNLRQKLAERGMKRFSTKFNWDVIADIWLKQLQDLHKNTSTDQS